MLSVLWFLAAATVVRAEATPSFSIQMLDTDSNPIALAGAHPDVLRISFALEEEGASLRDLELALPPGLGGSSNAVPLCPRALYESGEECPPESQVGAIRVAASGGTTLSLPLFQLEPQPGEILAIGSRPSLSLPLTAQIRPDDFGITLVGHELPPGAIGEGEFELWGIPADHQEGTSIPRRPFLTTPTTCGPVVFGFRARTWAEGAQWASASGDTGVPLAGCEELAFEPQLEFALSEPIADSPTGLSVDLKIPSETEGSERAPAEAKGATIKFPAGITVSPGGAEGLVACTDAQLGLGDGGPAHCPAQAKIGRAELVSNALGGPLEGTIYVGEERPGEQVRSFLVVPAPGIELKFVSAMQVDASTGRLSTVMKGLPQVPIQRIGLDFDGGPRALFAAPLSCGRGNASASVTPYGGGPAVGLSAPVTIGAATPGADCAPPPFAPELRIASSSRRAGAPTAVSTVLRRRPGEQLPRAFLTTMPPGLSAMLGTVTLCQSDAATLGNCPLESRIGGATAAVGSGPMPAVLHGDVYLTGPYRGAPFGLLMRFGGAAGPLDLGGITTRSALQVDPHTGTLTVSTIGIPDSVNGLPVRFQRIELDLNRPGFLRNPTSCAPKEATAVLESQSGAIATSSSSLHLRGCRRLGFRPRVGLALLGRQQLRRHGSPALRVTARLRRNDTNMRAMKFVLPPSLKLGTGGLKELCSRPDALRGTCPAGSRIGTAKARTALLTAPLRGGVYMAQPKGDGLPDLWITLAGSGVRMELESHSARIHGGRYVTKLSGLPDTPLLTFSMLIGGPGSGVVQLRSNPCPHPPSRALSARVAVRAQDGSHRSFRTSIGFEGHCPVGRR